MVWIKSGIYSVEVPIPTTVAAFSVGFCAHADEIKDAATIIARKFLISIAPCKFIRPTYEVAPVPTAVTETAPAAVKATRKSRKVLVASVIVPVNVNPVFVVIVAVPLFVLMMRSK